MSSLAGLWNRDGRPVDLDLLSAMSAGMTPGADGEKRWSQGAFGLACRNHFIVSGEAQPAAHASGLGLVFDGRLDNRDELLAALDHPSLGSASSDASLLLAAYRKWGDNAPERLQGDFALAVMDAPGRKILLARDVFGARPLYYAQNSRTALFASEIKALLAHPDIFFEPDDDQLADFLINGGYDASSTFFKNVFSVAPGTQVIITPGHVSRRRYWDFDASARVRLASFSEYAEAFRAVFETSVRRRMRAIHPVSVSVSGGLDSSSIFCAAHGLMEKGAAPPKGVAYVGPAGSPADENGFLSLLERRCRTPIHRFPMGPSECLDTLEEQIRRVETPFLDDQWSHHVRFLDNIRQQGSRVLLSGLWGDQYLASYGYWPDLFKRFRWPTLWAHVRGFETWFTDARPGAFRGHLLKQLAGASLGDRPYRFLASLRRRLKEPCYSRRLHDLARRRAYQGSDGAPPFASHHARSLYRQTRMGYYVLCLEHNHRTAASRGVEMAYPFLDRDLVSFLIAVPGEVINQGGVPKALLREAMRDALPEEIRQRRWKADFTDLLNQGMDRSFAELSRRLGPGSPAFARGYFRKDSLSNELAALKKGLASDNFCAARTCAKWLGLNQWLALFDSF